MKYSEALRILKKDGWMVKSQRGSHVKLVHNHKEGIIIFPNHSSKEIKKGTWQSIKKAAGILE